MMRDIRRIASRHTGRGHRKSPVTDPSMLSRFSLGASSPAYIFQIHLFPGVTLAGFARLSSTS